MGWRVRTPQQPSTTLRGRVGGWRRLFQTLRSAGRSPQEVTMQLGEALRKALLCVGMVAAACQMTATCTSTDLGEPELMTYELVAEYPHDHKAFTQGLHYENVCEGEGGQACRGIFWESTGLNGQSSVRKVDVSTGEVLSKTMLAHRHFGEGLTKLENALFQLTWLTNHLLVYDTNLQQVAEKRTPLHDGWGLATDGKQLLATDGSDTLFFIEPHSLELVRKVKITDGGQPIGSLNEIEWIEDEVWANVWMSDCIARIDPNTGKVNSWVLMHDLKHNMLKAGAIPRGHHIDVLNGIAWDPDNKRVFVTGKLWPRVYEIKLKTLQTAPLDTVQKLRRSCWRGTPTFF